MAFERELREISFIKRGGITRLVQHQSVAEHHYFMGMYAWQIACLCWGTDPDRAVDFMNLDFYCRWHDQPEGGLGDWPSPAKRELKKRVGGHDLRQMEMQTLSYRFGPEVPDHIEYIINQRPEIVEIAKAADILEWVLFLLTDVQLGNGTVGDIFQLNGNSFTYRRGTGIPVNAWAGHDFDSYLEHDDNPNEGILIRNLLWLAKAWSKLDFPDGPDGVPDGPDAAWVRHIVPAIVSHRWGISKQRY